MRLIDADAVANHLKERLIETAINNVGIMASADDVYREMAKNRIDVWIDELPTAEPQWIPCSEKVPEKVGEYIVTDDSGGLKCINISHFYPDAAPINGDDMRWDYINVTAWMPLPKPYKEGEKE